MKKVILTALSLLMMIPMVGCNNKSDTTKSKWNYTKDEMTRFIHFKNKVQIIGNDHYKMIIDEPNYGFSKDIDETDVILFKKENIKSNNKDGYITYKDLKATNVKTNKVSVSDDTHKIEIEFNGELDNTYGALLDKNVLGMNSYVLSEMDKPLKYQGFGAGEEGEWEKQYIDSEAEWSDGEAIFDIAKYIGDIIVGAISNCPTACVDGVFGIITTLGGQFLDEEPSMADIMNKLEEISGQITDLSLQIDANTKLLEDELIYTQAQIDKTLVTLFQQNYSDYVTHYVEPLQTIERDFSQYIESYLKDIVKEKNKTVDLHYEITEGGLYKLLSITEPNYNDIETKKYTITIKSFDNAKAFLEKHHDVVSEGFITELMKDIEVAVNSAIEKEIIKVDEKITVLDYKQHIYKVILEKAEKEKYTGDYGSDQYKEAQDIMDKAIKLANHISPIATGESIIKSLTDRLSCMYNFGHETKGIITKLLASFKLQLEKYMLMSSEACLFAKINQKELYNAYESAIKTIQSYSDSNDAIPESYSYITKTVLGSDFITAKYDVQYRNPGNDCEFKKEFISERIEGFCGYYLFTEKVNLSKYSYVKEVDHSKINTRFGMLKQTGLTKNSNYISYLGENEVISQDNINTYNALINAGWISDDAYRILTSYEGIKNVEKSDNISFKCVACGNPGGYYFKLNQRYNYKSQHDSDCWTGEKAAGAFIDGYSAEKQSNKVIAAYAKYAESHLLWSEDEYWAFQDNPYSNYTFIIYNKIA